LNRRILALVIAPVHIILSLLCGEQKRQNLHAPMKLFLTVFAAILAAAAVIMTGIYAKVRFDDWEVALNL
jgi:uncharacterized membrane protein